MAELYTLPDGWEWKTLDEIGKLFSGSSAPQKDEYFIDGKYPFIRTKDLSTYGRTDNLTEANDYINDKCINDSSLILAKKGTVLFPKSGASIGTNNRAKIGIDAYIVSHLGAFYSKEEVTNKYVYNYFLTIDLLDYCENPSYPSLKISRVKEIEIPLPPLEEQKRIVAKLDNLFAKIDKAIALHQKNCEEANVFMASVLNDVFVELEEKYTYTKLKDVVTKEKTSIKRGPFGSALKKSFFVENGYLVYEQYHALNNDFSMERYYIDENKFNELKGFEVKGGDIIISCSGVYLGKLAIIPNEYTKGIINQALLKLSLNKDVISNELFVYFWNNLMNNGFFDEVKKGAAIPNMPSVKELKEIGIPLPPLPTQQKVVSYLDEISQKMEILKQVQNDKMQSLKALKASILDQAFKGEL